MAEGKIYKHYVDAGFELLHPAMISFAVKAYRKKFGPSWWNEVLVTLSDQYDLPKFGDDKDLENSLDPANGLRLISRGKDVLFLYDKYSDVKNFKTWAEELMGVRNGLAHPTVADYPREDAERALDTMRRLCGRLDKPTALKLNELYREVRGIAEPGERHEAGYYPRADQNAADGTPSPNLLAENDPAIVEKTGLTRKLTIDGKTEAYPVYRVRLDRLYYNDRNDRILTWIAQYKDETGIDDLSCLSREEYNDIIEQFIIDSNPQAIDRTKNNIALVGQREAGVILADGRIADGNRRFTCLRLLSKEDGAPRYFETVILKNDLKDSEKQIKMLELTIQHGEEQRVDYNQVDLAIGAYLDIKKTRLLTLEEYAESTNEEPSEVKKRLEIAGLIMEFLQFAGVPEQYHIARDMQVYSIINELLPALHKCESETAMQELKTSVFNNVILDTFPDKRKYIRDLRALQGTSQFRPYILRQNKLNELLTEKKNEYGIGGEADLRGFAAENEEIRNEMRISMEKALTQSKKTMSRNKPAQNVTKCVNLLMDIDTGIFSKLTAEERDTLKTHLKELMEIAAMLESEVSDAAE